MALKYMSLFWWAVMGSTLGHRPRKQDTKLFKAELNGSLTAMGDTIIAIGPCSAMASRGQIELRYPPMSPPCLVDFAPN